MSIISIPNKIIIFNVPIAQKRISKAPRTCMGMCLPPSHAKSHSSIKPSLKKISAKAQRSSPNLQVGFCSWQHQFMILLSDCFIIDTRKQRFSGWKSNRNQTNRRKKGENKTWSIPYFISLFCRYFFISQIRIATSFFPICLWLV